MNVPESVGSVRMAICKKCKEPCEPWKAGTMAVLDGCASCPVARWGTYNSCPEFGPVAPPAVVSLPDPKAEAGRMLWSRLHQTAKTGFDQAWLTQWEVGIPGFGGCQCRKDYAEIKKKIPVRWDDLFAWTVDIHNAVNQKLAKPQLSLAEARALWGGNSAAVH